jgi:uncharacterized protein (TIGR02996 family)
LKTATVAPEALRPFLLAVCHDPHDDAPRLILADFLDERGESDRASLIREQVAAARVPKPPPDPCALPKWSAEPNPWAALIKANWSEWTWPLVVRWKSPEWFRRGFMEQVELDRKTFLRHAGTLFRHHPILGVKLPTASGRGQGYYRIYLDASMHTRGGQALVPGPLFPFLANVGHPCTIRGGRAELEGDRWTDFPASLVLSRAAVNFGRHEAGLPPIRWGPLPNWQTNWVEEFER